MNHSNYREKLTLDQASKKKYEQKMRPMGKNHHGPQGLKLTVRFVSIQLRGATKPVFADIRYIVFHLHVCFIPSN